MTALLLALAALAAPVDQDGPPEWLAPPAPREAEPEDCATPAGRSVAIRPGQPLPAHLYEMRDGVPVATCRAEVMATQLVLDLHALEDWGYSVADHTRVELVRRDAREAVLQEELHRLRHPPLLERPGVQRVVGNVEVLLVLGVTAVMVHGVNSAFD